MKKFISMLAMTAVVAAFWACEDDPTPDNGVTITGIPATAEIDNLGTVGPVTATIEAADGLVSLVVTKGATPFASETYTGETSATYDFTYTATAADEDALVTFTFVATDADGDVATVTHVLSVGAAPVIPTEIEITSNVTENTTWETGKTYVLAGRVAVVSGVTLTIQPGVVIKGGTGTGANAKALVIARGAKLMAEGTATLPIIFTSVADEITPADIAAGNFASPNLKSNVNGLWGGLIVLGKAQISGKVKDPVTGDPTAADAVELQIEGIPTSDANGLYGGTDDADNSGSIKYISIRHGGTNIGSGNEINGLTLGGVGSGTVIENVEIVANQDDGIEWFGGTVSVKNIVVWNVGDDGLDTDQAWSGTAENFVIFTSAGHSFELDGPEGTFGTAAGTTTAFHTFKNGTVVSTDDIESENLVNFDNNSGFKMENVFFTEINESNANHIINRLTATTGISEYTGVVLNVTPANLDNFIDGSGVPTGITAGTTGTKADVSVFGWTWAAEDGKLAGL